MSITEKPQKIFISLDDSIPYVLDLINSAHSAHIILVVEESSGVISTLVSMKILLREIIKLEKVAIIQTRDQKAKHFGEQVGFVVVEQTSEIAAETWKEAERANDTFKSIYASRKEELSIKRKSEVVPLGNNLHDDSVWKQNLSTPDDTVNFDEVVDVPVISTIDQDNEIKEIPLIAKSVLEEENLEDIQPEGLKLLKDTESKIPHGKPKNIKHRDEYNVTEKLYSENLVNETNEVFTPAFNGPEKEAAKEVNFEPRWQNEAPTNLKDQIPNGSLEIHPKELHRPSFEELYKQAKERKSNKEILPNLTNKTSTDNIAPSRRYVPKLIRNSGIVIAPGGDILDFEEVNPEIIKDEIDFKPISTNSELGNGGFIRHANPEVSFVNRGGQSETNLNPQKNTENTEPVYIPTNGGIERNNNINEETPPKIPGFKKAKKVENNNLIDSLSKISSKIDMKKIKTTIINYSVIIVNASKKVLSNLGGKIKSMKAKSSTRSINKNIGRQFIPIDPLSKNKISSTRSSFIPIDRKKFVRNTYRILSIGLIFFIVWFAVTVYFLINAQVVLAVTPIDLLANKNLEFQVVNETLINDDTSASESSAQRTSLLSELGESIKTTTTKDLGQKAEGNITLYNKTDKDIVLASGTRLQVEVASKNFNFFLKSEVTVPKRLVKTIRTDNGFIDARVVFENTGTDGNIPSDLLGEQNRFAIDGFTSSELEGISFLGFSGGTNNIVKVVSQGDIEQLKKNVETKIKEDISNKLKSKFALDYEIITPEIKYETLKQEYTGEVGNVADKVDLFMQMKGEIIVIQKDKIKKNIEAFYQLEKAKLLKDSSGENTQEKTENWTYSYEIVNSSDKSVTVSVKLVGKLLPQISKSEIENMLFGKSEEEARAILGKLKNLKVVNLEINPAYLPDMIRKIPNDKNKVNLVFENVIL